MRSYTNKDGLQVEVTEEHLQTAVHIKQELQKSVPSRRCNWKTLVNMMDVEGFDDAENSENYRQLIKNYQKSIGELPDVKSYADMVSGGKLEAIRQAVGEIAYEKRDAQNVFRELNKLKRDIIDFSVTAEQIGLAFAKHDWSELSLKVEPKPKTEGKIMIACLSDMHIGAFVQTDINTFNYEVAIRRLEDYAGIIISNAKANDISTIHIVNLGDVIEHSTMRHTQGFHAEFVYNDQIVRASDAIIKFLKIIAEERFHLTYAGIAGNHDRANDKDKTVDGDHAVKPINHAVKLFIDHGKYENIEYRQAKNYDYNLLDVNGLNFKFVHGDLDSLRNEGLVAKHSDLDNQDYTAIVMGHFHHHRNLEVGYRKHIIAFGSLKGADEYGEKIRKISAPSQGFILVGMDGKIEVERVELD